MLSPRTRNYDHGILRRKKTLPLIERILNHRKINLSFLLISQNSKGAFTPVPVASYTEFSIFLRVATSEPSEHQEQVFVVDTPAFPSFQMFPFKYSDDLSVCQSRANTYMFLTLSDLHWMSCHVQTSPSHAHEKSLNQKKKSRLRTKFAKERENWQQNMTKSLLNHKQQSEARDNMDLPYSPTWSPLVTLQLM